MKTYKLKEVEDKLIGKIGTPKRDDYELRIKLIQFGQLIKEVRREKGLTQDGLGDLIGVTKSQISKLENGTSNMTIGTIFKIFEAMKSEVHFEVKEMVSSR
jgi:DNA-binding XRE family transcriptional regulator